MITRNSMSKGIVGKVQYEDVQTIWNVYLPSPKEIEDVCEKYMDIVLTEQVSEYKEDYNNTSWVHKFWMPTPCEMEKEIKSTTLKHFFNGDDGETLNFDYFRQMYESAQMIKLVLKVKRVAAKCSNNLYVEECYLDAIKDVVNHLDYYENILKNYREDFDIK